GDDDAAAEAIVEALLLLARNSEPGSLDELRVDLPARERLAQRVPQVGRVPEPPRFRGLDGDATPLQVIAGDGSTGMFPENALIEDARLFIDLRERRPVRAATRLLRIRGLQVDASLGRQLLRRLAEALAVELHDELDRVAGRAAAEAVEDLLVGDDIEAGRLLAVEGAQAFPVAARLLQADAALHHRDHVDAVAQLLQLLV